jgi:hypothetical protein
METVAPGIPVDVVLSVTCPLSVNVVVVGGGVVLVEGEVGVLFPPPQAVVTASKTDAHTRLSISDYLSELMAGLKGM